MEKYGKEIYNLIVEGAGAKVICKMIGVCTGDSTAIRTTDSKFKDIPGTELKLMLCWDKV